ncbi:MAG: cation diffusion facilitator family transporter [Lachnospiraceae bacterium]|nr:cation diffusion facilitator family transporter [Lachnospiraceae bacterium]
MDFLFNKFIENAEDVRNPEVRSRYGVFAGGVGIACNLLLTLFKIVLGLLTGTLSIVVDAVNNLSDAVSSIVTLIGFKVSGKPADQEHPFGHGRIEYISGFIVSASVIAVALELLKTSISNIISHNKIHPDKVTIIILVAAIIVKVLMGNFYMSISKKIKSAAMRATAMDSFTDCIMTGVSLISVCLFIFFGLNIDAIASALVSLIVIYSGIQTAKDTVLPLVGEAPSEELVDEIREIALANPSILGVHDLRVHEYGPEKTFCSMHAELPADLTLIEAHDVVDEVEDEIIKAGIVEEITIHIDPIQGDDSASRERRTFVEGLLKNIDENATITSFRYITGKQDNIISFNASVPESCEMEKNEIKEKLTEEIISKYEGATILIHVKRT